MKRSWDTAFATEPMNVELDPRDILNRSFLQSAPDAILDELQTAASVRRTDAGELLCSQGRPVDRLVMLLKGTLRIEACQNGQTHRLEFCEAFKSLDVPSVLDGGVWHYSVRALSQSVVLEIPQAKLARAMALDPEYARASRLLASNAAAAKLLTYLRKIACGQKAANRLLASLVCRRAGSGEIAWSGATDGWALACGNGLDLIAHGALEPVLAPMREGEFVPGRLLCASGGNWSIRARQPGFVLFSPAAEVGALLEEHPLLEQALTVCHPDLQARLPPAEQASVVPFAAPGRRKADCLPVHPWARPTPRSIEGQAQHRRMLGVPCASEGSTAAAAAASLLEFHGISARTGWRQMVLDRPGGPSLLDVAATLEARGLVTHSVTALQPDDMQSLVLPAITVLEQDFVVVHRISRRVATTFHPRHGLLEVPLAEFARSWSHQCLLADARFRPALTARRARSPGHQTGRGDREGPPRIWALLRTCLGLHRRAPPQVRALAAIVCALLVAGIVSPPVTALALDQALAHRDTSVLNAVFGGLVLVSLTTLLLQAARGAVSAYLGQQIEHHLGTLFYRQALGSSGLEESRVGDVLARFREVVRIRRGLTAELFDAAIDIVSSVVYTTALFIYRWQIALVMLFAAVVAVPLVRVAGRRYRALYDAAFRARARATVISTEQVLGMATIKSADAEDFAIAGWEGAVRARLDVERSIAATRVFVTAASSLARHSAVALVLFMAVRVVAEGSDMSTGDVLAVTQYLSLALLPLSRLDTYLEQFHEVSTSVKQLGAFFEAPSEVSPLDGDRHRPPRSRGNLSLRSVSFRYSDDSELALDDISLSICVGERIAVVGRSGSGKTTLAKLIQGLLAPTSGAVYLDGKDIRQLPRDFVCRSIALVTQEVHLFSGTVADNICYGDDRPDMVEVKRAAELAAADPFIKSLPNGYETQLAEGGMGLSGGQRQRIGLARALYSKPSLIVMDEATSSLDAAAIATINANMSTMVQGRTSIVIAHRISTVQDADRILVLDGGRIVEDGTHAQLLARGGVYAAMVRQQGPESHHQASGEVNP